MQIDLSLGETQRILAVCRRAGLLRAQTAYVLATAYWETNRTMLPVEEAYWLADDWREKNLRYYPWHGRGFVQLTWKANYQKASAKIGVDLIADPSRAMEPDVAAQILVQGMVEGWFTGKKLADYIDGARVDFVGARRIVNGTDRAAEIAAIAEAYLAALPDDQGSIWFRIFKALWGIITGKKQ
ncbi:carboxypeptidase [Ketogulonicigenium vulgare]|uniref:carboxypeptidase n=1 Tax=Ketogulonicigenium vulgare TaxID=92945 RepID=UPI002358C972|nr:carboxypeptidase [Ketogulonicigenium vulgare]